MCFETSFLGKNVKKMPKQKVAQNVVMLGLLHQKSNVLSKWKIAQSGHPTGAGYQAVWIGV